MARRCSSPVRGNPALREALNKVFEVAAGAVGVADEFRRHGRKEGEIRGGIKRCGLVVVTVFEGTVPRFEVFLFSFKRVVKYSKNCALAQQIRSKISAKMHGINFRWKFSLAWAMVYILSRLCGTDGSLKLFSRACDRGFAAVARSPKRELDLTTGFRKPRLGCDTS